MAGLPGVDAFPKWQIQRYDFAVHNLAISQTALVLKRGVNDAASGTLLNVGVVAPAAGFIIGLTANLLAVLTHTALSLSPSIAAAEVATTCSLYRVAMEVATPSIISKFVDYSGAGLGFTAGQLLGLMVTTDANMLPNGSADLDAQLWVAFPLQI